MKRICIFIIIITVIPVSYINGDSLRVVANPCQRSMATMITDTLNQRIILFGGQDYGFTNEYFNDIWAYDCLDEQWTPIIPTGPAPSKRRNAALAYRCLSNNQNSMYLFGGRMSSSFYNDVWVLNLQQGFEQWIQIFPSGTPPSQRTEVTGMYDPVSNRLIFFGGDGSSGRNNETWEFDISTNTWNQLFPSGTLPTPRSAYAAVYDHIGHRMIVFSGAASPIVSDVWALDLTSGSENWQRLFPGGPQPQGRGQQFCAYDSELHRMIIGFGFDFPVTIEYLSDAWSLDLDSLRWRCILNPGIVYSRRGTCGAFNPVNGEIVIFGGDHGSSAANTYSIYSGTIAVEENRRRLSGEGTLIEMLSSPARIPIQYRINIGQDCHAKLNVYDMSGRHVCTLMDNQMVSGNYLKNWSGCDESGRKVPSGTYFFKLDINGEALIKKAVIIE